MKRVYFIKPIGMDGPIKIGCSDWPKSRISQLEIDTRLKYEFLAIAPGDFWTERNLHRKFAGIRTDPPFAPRRYGQGGVTEWFKPEPVLLAFIELVKATERVHLADDERIELMVAKRRAEGRTYKAIGHEFGFSRQRAHQIVIAVEERAAWAARSPTNHPFAAVTNIGRS